MDGLSGMRQSVPGLTSYAPPDTSSLLSWSSYPHSACFEDGSSSNVARVKVRRSLVPRPRVIARMGSRPLTPAQRATVKDTMNVVLSAQRTAGHVPLSRLQPQVVWQMGSGKAGDTKTLRSKLASESCSAKRAHRKIMKVEKTSAEVIPTALPFSAAAGSSQQSLALSASQLKEMLDTPNDGRKTVVTEDPYVKHRKATSGMDYVDLASTPEAVCAPIRRTVNLQRTRSVQASPYTTEERANKVADWIAERQVRVDRRKDVERRNIRKDRNFQIAHDIRRKAAETQKKTKSKNHPVNRQPSKNARTLPVNKLEKKKTKKKKAGDITLVPEQPRHRPVNEPTLSELFRKRKIMDSTSASPPAVKKKVRVEDEPQPSGE